jgi:hypothetical protein
MTLLRIVIPPYLLVEHDPRHARGQAFSESGIRPARAGGGLSDILFDISSLAASIIVAAAQHFIVNNNGFTTRLLRQWSLEV